MYIHSYTIYNIIKYSYIHEHNVLRESISTLPWSLRFDASVSQYDAYGRPKANRSKHVKDPIKPVVSVCFICFPGCIVRLLFTVESYADER